MKRSKVIIELIKDEINVVQAMDILNILLQDLNDKKIKYWLNNEINGYEKDQEIPEYRIVEANIVGNYIVGSIFHGLQCTNQPIPIKPEVIKEYTKINVRSGLNEILQMSVAEKENEKQDKLDKVVDDLKQKYGYNSITRAGKLHSEDKIKLKIDNKKKQKLEFLFCILSIAKQ